MSPRYARLEERVEADMLGIGCERAAGGAVVVHADLGNGDHARVARL